MMSVVHSAKWRDWRWVFLLGVLLYASLVFIVGSRGGHVAQQRLLQGLGVPALEYPFMDMRGVAVWCDAWVAGIDPATEKSWLTLPDGTRHLDFFMNYSPLILAFRHIGLSERHVTLWSAVMIAFYLAALWFLCGKCSSKSAFLWLLLVCSPISVLVMERGNLDMFLFAMLVAALLLRKYPLLESVVILGASMLKFFPIGALPALWREGGKRNRLAVTLAAFGFGVFLFCLRSRLSAIGGSLAGQYQSSFGCVVIPDLLHHHGFLNEGKWGLSRNIMTGLGIVWVIVPGVAGLFSKGSIPLKVDARLLHAFFLTAPIMLGLFVLGNQMDYKWIFFLPMVPAVRLLLESQSRLDASVSKLWIAGILAYSYWTFYSDEGSLRNAFLKQALMWGVMAATAFLAGRLWKNREVQ